MDALEFLMERNRLCGSYRGCVGCPFGAAECVIRDMTSEVVEGAPAKDAAERVSGAVARG